MGLTNHFDKKGEERKRRKGEEKKKSKSGHHQNGWYQILVGWVGEVDGYYSGEWGGAMNTQLIIIIIIYPLVHAWGSMRRGSPQFHEEGRWSKKGLGTPGLSAKGRRRRRRWRRKDYYYNVERESVYEAITWGLMEKWMKYRWKYKGYEGYKKNTDK